MRTHRWIRLSFLNFPSDLLSARNVRCSVQIDDITRILCRACKKCALDFLLRFTLQKTHTHTRVRSFSYSFLHEGLFFVVVVVVVVSSLLCAVFKELFPFVSFCLPCFLVTPLVHFFFNFFQISAQKATLTQGRKDTQKHLFGIPLFVFYILSFVLRLGALCLR